MKIRYSLYFWIIVSCCSRHLCFWFLTTIQTIIDEKYRKTFYRDCYIFQCHLFSFMFFNCFVTYIVFVLLYQFMFVLITIIIEIFVRFEFLFKFHSLLRMDLQLILFRVYEIFSLIHIGWLIISSLFKYIIIVHIISNIYLFLTTNYDNV